MQLWKSIFTLKFQLVHVARTTLKQKINFHVLNYPKQTIAYKNIVLRLPLTFELLQRWTFSYQKFETEVNWKLIAVLDDIIFFW